LDKIKQNLDSAKPHFGLRLRAMLERRGNPFDEFVATIGISRATLFNWYKREKKPPSRAHQTSLVAYFGNQPPDFVLDGKLDQQSKPRLPTAPITVQEEMPPLPRVVSVDIPAGRSATYDVADEIRQDLEEAIASTGGEMGRLGWLREEFRSLKNRAPWLRVSPK